MTCALRPAARRCRRIACAMMCHPWRGSVRSRATAMAFWQARSGSGPFTLGRMMRCFWVPWLCTPTRQGEGLGGSLIRDSLETARSSGWERVLLVGDAPYYARFGFSQLSGVDMPPPTNPERVLGLELQEGAWQGVSGDVTRWQS